MQNIITKKFENFTDTQFKCLFQLYTEIIVFIKTLTIFNSEGKLCTYQYYKCNK